MHTERRFIDEFALAEFISLTTWEHYRQSCLLQRRNNSQAKASTMNTASNTSNDRPLDATRRYANQIASRRAAGRTTAAISVA